MAIGIHNSKSEMTEETRQRLEYIIDKLRLELHTGLSREELINLINND